MTQATTAPRTFGYRHRHGLLLAFLLATVTAAGSLVAPPRDVGAASLSTQPPVGRLWATNCFQCHGTDGQSGGFDQLAGDDAKDLYEKLKDQQTKNTIMGSHARGYTDAELRAIAAYFASVQKK